MVKGKGVNLAKHGQRAGIRIQVPGHLMSNFRALESMAYHLKQKDGGVRRVVKFDEDAQDLFMDIKIAGDWKRIYPDQVRTVQAARPEIKAGPAVLSADAIQSLLGGSPATGANSAPLGE